MTYPVLTVKSGKDRALINRHPWLFSGAVKDFPKASDGEIVFVNNNQGQTLASGFYSPNSQIVCRLFEFDDFNSDYTQVEYWKNKIEKAKSVREAFIDRSVTNTYRLIHAEGDNFPGVIADVYNETVVLQILIKGTLKLLSVIQKAFNESGFQYLFLRSKNSSRNIELLDQQDGWIGSEGETNVFVEENSLKFHIEIDKGQKTGFFIDQRENRKLLREISKGKNVLNTFSYSGGFSAYALAGGASKVVSVDISKEAIRLCDENIELNFPGTKDHESYAQDCFEFLRRSEDQYDIIVLDPPAFAKNARSVPNACRGYKDLNLLAFKMIRKNGFILTFSCSQNVDPDLFQKVVFSAAADAKRNVRIVKRLGQPADHPVSIYHPEGEYLKGLLLYVD